jgi:hypothetical protein
MGKISDIRAYADLHPITVSRGVREDMRVAWDVIHSEVFFE